MKRVAFALSIVSLLLLFEVPDVLAAGGGNPPPIPVRIVGPTVNGMILMDPHPGGQATVYLNKGQAQVSFQFLSGPGFPLTAGCVDVLDPTVFGSPIQRFLFTSTNQKNLTDWVPPFVLESMFLPLGIGTFPTAPVWPAITQINSAQCVQSPAGTGTFGWLIMDVTINFLVPLK
jgi:hypothetical protein